MEYIGRVPAPPLDRFVDDVYCMAGVPRHRRLSVPPMPSAHLFVNLAGPVRVRDSDAGVPSAVFTDGWFMGVWTRRYVIEFSSAVLVAGVHFKPWGMAGFVGLSSADFRDRWVPADAVWGRTWDRARDRIAEAATTTDMLDTLEDELRRRLVSVPPRGLELVQHTAGRLAATWGGIPVSALTDGAGVSGNHLAAQFKSHLGVTPKHVARIYRFARLILSVEGRGPVDWAALAHASGYYDQAHMSREFKDFTGYSPTDYLALRRRFPAEEGFPPDKGPIPTE